MAKKTKAKVDKVQNKRIAKLEKEFEASENFAEVQYAKTITGITTTVSAIQPPIAQGIESYQRLGNAIKPLSLDISFRYEIDTTVQKFDSVRTIIVRVPEVGGVIPTLGQVLYDISTTPNAMLTAHSYVNTDNFVYIYDKTMDINPYDVTGISTYTRHFRVPKRHLKLQKFSGASGATSDFVNNQFFVFFVALNNGATGVDVKASMKWNP